MAVTPFMLVVIMEPLSLNEAELELIIEEVEVSPFTMEVNVFTAEFS